MTVGKVESNVFGFLDHVRARPAMYLRDNSLSELDTLIRGYCVALGVHGKVEPVPSMGSHFNDWLGCRTSWSTCKGWAYAISSQHPDPDAALRHFFAFVNEYRKLRPTPLWRVELGSENEPTGKRIRFGDDRRIEKPERVEILQYAPEPYFFLRFRYGRRCEDQHLLMNGKGEHAVSVGFAKSWARDEFRVKATAWARVPSSRRP
jgi:hypothetical protein